MSFMDKIKDYITPVDEDAVDYDGSEQTAEAPVSNPVSSQSTYEKSSAPQAPALDAKTKMVLFEPRSFNEAELAGARLKEGRAVVVNLHKLDKEYSQRTIDFLSGVVFALNGKVQKIGQQVILCYPEEIGVAGAINLVDEAAAEEEAE